MDALSKSMKITSLSPRVKHSQQLDERGRSVKRAQMEHIVLLYFIKMLFITVVVPGLEIVLSGIPLISSNKQQNQFLPHNLQITVF